MISLLLLAAALYAPCSDVTIQDAARSSEIIVLAEVVEVGPPLGLWSGGYVVAQRVDYEIKEVLKGDIQEKKIGVAHYVIAGSSTVDDKVARLSPVLFKRGNRLLLFLVRDVDPNYIIFPESDRQRVQFLAKDFCGALLSNERLLAFIRTIRRDRK